MPTEIKIFPYKAKFEIIKDNHRSDYLEIYVTNPDNNEEHFALRMKRTDLIDAIGGNAKTCRVQTK